MHFWKFNFFIEMNHRFYNKVNVPTVSDKTVQKIVCSMTPRTSCGHTEIRNKLREEYISFKRGGGISPENENYQGQSFSKIIEKKMYFKVSLATWRGMTYILISLDLGIMIPLMVKFCRIGAVVTK